MESQQSTISAKPHNHDLIQQIKGKYNNQKLTLATFSQPSQQNQQSIKSDSIQAIDDYEWLEFDTGSSQSIQYLKEFLSNKPLSVEQLIQLDLQGLIEEDKCPINSVQLIAREHQQRLLKFGDIVQCNKIAKKTQGLDKGYYDLDDDFICDDDIDLNLKQLAICEAEITDFCCFQGDINEFVQSECYQNRLRDIEQYRNVKEVEKQIKQQKNKQKCKKLNKQMKLHGPSQQPGKLTGNESQQSDDNQHHETEKILEDLQSEGEQSIKYEQNQDQHSQSLGGSAIFKQNQFIEQNRSYNLFKKKNSQQERIEVQQPGNQVSFICKQPKKRKRDDLKIISVILDRSIQNPNNNQINNI